MEGNAPESSAIEPFISPNDNVYFYQTPNNDKRIYWHRQLPSLGRK